MGGDRTILAMDTATPDVAVAAVRNGEPLAVRSIPPEPGGRPRAATALLPAVEAIVDAAGGWAVVGLIGVGVGPGSFTGLRIGVATARALAQATSTPVASVGTLAALAHGALAKPGERPVLAVVDARRGEVFAALYGGSGNELWAPWVAAAEAVAERLSGLDQSPLAVGDGSVRFRAELEAAGAEVAADGEAVHALSAESVAALAAGTAPTRPEEIEPIYLRRPDAELWRERTRKTDLAGG